MVVPRAIGIDHSEVFAQRVFVGFPGPPVRPVQRLIGDPPPASQGFIVAFLHQPNGGGATNLRGRHLGDNEVVFFGRGQRRGSPTKTFREVEDVLPTAPRPQAKQGVSAARVSIDRQRRFDGRRDIAPSDVDFPRAATKGAAHPNEIGLSRHSRKAASAGLPAGAFVVAARQQGAPATVVHGDSSVKISVVAGGDHHAIVLERGVAEPDVTCECNRGGLIAARSDQRWSIGIAVQTGEGEPAQFQRTSILTAVVAGDGPAEFSRQGDAIQSPFVGAACRVDVTDGHATVEVVAPRTMGIRASPPITACRGRGRRGWGVIALLNGAPEIHRGLQRHTQSCRK